MKTVFGRIAERQKKYDQHPFILFLRDESRSAHERLAYAPFVCHFVMTFAEFNRAFLHSNPEEMDRGQSSRSAKGRETDGWNREEGTGFSNPSELQSAIDVHAEEDGRHYSWYLQDLKTLGFDVQLSLTEALRFVFSKKGFAAREFGYYAIAAVRNADPEVRIAVIEAVEAMGNLYLTAAMEAAKVHPDGERLIYFGQHHLDRETGHAIGGNDDQIAAIPLSQHQREIAIELVDGLYDRMEAFNSELLQRVNDVYADEGADPSEPLQNYLPF